MAFPPEPEAVSTSITTQPPPRQACPEGRRSWPRVEFPAKYKWFARRAVAKTVVKALGKGIKLRPPALDPEVIKAAKSPSCKELAALGLNEPKPTKG
jgi:hypothetical protein